MEYWIWSNEHGAWWRSDERGYTRALQEAGRYAQSMVDRILAQANLAVADHEWPNEVAVPVNNSYLTKRALAILAAFERDEDLLKDWTPTHATDLGV